MDNTALNRRRHPRIKCERTGYLMMPTSDIKIPISTSEISQGGFKANLPERIFFGSRMFVSVELSETVSAQMTVQPVWADEENNFGFKIENATPNWVEFVTALE